MPRRSFIYYVAARPCLSEHARTASLHGLNLGLAPGQTAEASGELGAVEEFTRLGADGAKRGASLTTDAAAELGATERAVLLGLGPVGSEGVWESTQRRGGVDARSVVDGLYGMMLAGFPMPELHGRARVSHTRDGTLAQEADERSASSVAESESGTHYDGGGGWKKCGRIRGCRVRVCEIQRGPVVAEPTDARGADGLEVEEKVVY